MATSPSPVSGSLHPDNQHLGTFTDAFAWFSVPAHSAQCLVLRRWPDGVVRCPVCGRDDVRYLEARELWECKTKHPKSQFSVRVGTIFEDSHIPLALWLATIWMAANTGMPSSHELARTLGITQKSAWSMLRRIKCAWQKASSETHDSHSELSVRERRSGSPPWE